MESSIARQFSGISEHSPLNTRQAIEGWLILLRLGSLASLSASQESEKAPTTSAICGQRPLKSSKPSNRNGLSWKTSQDYWVSIDTLRQSSKTFPKRGMMCAGFVCPLPKLERRTKESGCGSWLPTPSASSYGSNQGGARKNVWPTPRAVDFKGCVHKEAAQKARDRGFNPSLQELVAEKSNGGRLNPTWVEWLMGWPIGSTDLKPLETDKYHQWLEKHGDT